jgi:flavorubredoxin
MKTTPKRKSGASRKAPSRKAFSRKSVAAARKRAAAAPSRRTRVPAPKPAARPVRPKIRGRTVIVYYSRFGATATVAQALARELAAESREIRARKRLSWLAMGFGAVFNIRYRIEPMDFDFTHFGLVVLCSPIWASKPACHLMTFLDAARLQGTRSALVFTTSGGEVERTVDAMKAILEQRGSQVIASESIMCRKVPEDILRAHAREFALELKKRY